MPARIPLTGRFARQPFLQRDALDEGWSRSRLRGADLATPFRGVRAPRPVDREHAYVPLLRTGERFSHTSAGRLWGAPLPTMVDEVHVTRSEPTRTRLSGVVGHRSAAGGAAQHDGLPVSDPLTTFLELATMLDVPDLVAVGDHLVLVPRVLDPLDIRPHLPLSELLAGCSAARGRGSRLARTAAALVRVGAESRSETRLRLLARDAGLPEPELGRELLDERGRWIGFFDLTWPTAHLIAEYDGDQHRTSTRQYERDIRRFDRATDAGYRVIRVRAAGLRDRAETMWRLADAYRRAGTL